MIQRLKHKAAILFDLDGTFADTSEDIFSALAEALLTNGYAAPAQAWAALRPAISRGSYQLLRDALPQDTDEALVKHCQQRFLEIYAANCSDPEYHRRTRVFAGIEGLLQKIAEAAIPWGIVTNKRSHFTLPLLTAMGLAKAPAIIVSGDTLAYAKPHPAPLLYACRQLQVENQGSVYVGDAKTDVIAAHAAGLYAVVAAWGYIENDADITQWGADAIATQPAQLLPWLARISPAAGVTSA